MAHPIYSAVLRHPELLAAHLANYVALIHAETSEAGRKLVARTLAGALALASGLVALGLTGAAVMLGVMHAHFHWALAAVPLVGWVIAGVAGFLARRPMGVEGFDELRAQLEADVQALQLAGERHG